MNLCACPRGSLCIACPSWPRAGRALAGRAQGPLGGIGLGVDRDAGDLISPRGRQAAASNRRRDRRQSGRWRMNNLRRPRR